MSTCDKAKVDLRPRDPRATLDATMPRGESIYGAPVRTHKRMRLIRTHRVDLDYVDEVVQTDTGWLLQKTEDQSYNPKVVEQSGHFHADAKGRLVGFCPNESLSFTRVNELIAQLTAPTQEVPTNDR